MKIKRLCLIFIILISIGFTGKVFSAEPRYGGEKSLDVDRYGGLETAITTIGATEMTVVITTAQALIGNLTIPNTMGLTIIKGGSIALAGHTLTINGSFEAGLYQVFSGAGTVVFGDGAIIIAYAEWWGIDGTADQVQINQALVAAGNCQLLNRNTYSINDSINIGDRDRLLGSNGSDTIIEFDYSVTGTPILNVSGYSINVENLKLQYSSLPPNTDTLAVAISFSDDVSNTAWASFRNIYIQRVYAGIGGVLADAVGGTLVFNNYYENIQIRNFSGWGIYLTFATSGNLFNSIYINNNDGGAQPALGLIYYSGENTGFSRGTFNQLNLEHAVVSEQNPITFKDNHVQITGLHIEGISYAHATPSGIYLDGNSWFNISGVEFNSVTANVANGQTSYDVIRVDGIQVRVNIINITLGSNCDLNPTGDASWLGFPTGIGGGVDGAQVRVTGAWDNSGDSVISLNLTTSTDSPALRQFNSNIFEFEARLWIADDAATSFTPTVNQGLMHVMVSEFSERGGLFRYDIQSGASTNIDMFAGLASRRYSATDTWDPGDLADGAGETKAVTCTGAALGDTVTFAAPYDLQDLICTGYVQAANLVELRLQNENAGANVNLGSGTWRVTAIRENNNFEVTTGALTGTDGNDGALTVSVHTDGKIYVENRTGVFQAIYFKVLAGLFNTMPRT